MRGKISIRNESRMVICQPYVCNYVVADKYGTNSSLRTLSAKTYDGTSISPMMVLRKSLLIYCNYYKNNNHA